MEDCHFCICGKKAYEKCLLQNNLKIHNDQLDFFLSVPLFRGVDRTLFSLKYLKFFSLNKIIKGQTILSENDDNTGNAYFIYQGEFILSAKKSILQLTGIITKLGGNISKNEINQYTEKESFREFIRKPQLFKVIYNLYR